MSANWGEGSYWVCGQTIEPDILVSSITEERRNQKQPIKLSPEVLGYFGLDANIQHH